MVPIDSTIQKVVAQNPSVTPSKLKMESCFYEDQKDELEEQN